MVKLAIWPPVGIINDLVHMSTWQVSIKHFSRTKYILKIILLLQKVLYFVQKAL